MILSTKHKFCFMSPPKTGCGFRENALMKECDFWSKKSLMRDRHITLDNFFNNSIQNNFLKEMLDGEYKIICFVRNPWERYISWMKMICTVNKDAYLHNFEEAPMEACVNKNPKIIKGDWIRKYRSLTHMISEAPRLSEYFEYENLNIEVIDFRQQTTYLQKIGKIFGLNFDLQDTAPPRTKEYRKYYDEKLMQLVLEKEKKVIELMHYKF